MSSRRRQTSGRRPARGVTLIEVMVVVAIVGVLGGISAGFTMQMMKSSRVNGAAKTVNAAIALGRQRAVTSGCAHFVQINGPTYAGAGPDGFPRGRGFVATVRKGDCFSNTYGFEAGDRVVDLERWSPEGAEEQVRLAAPPGVLTGPYLDADALVFGYDRFGRRGMWKDEAGAGAGAFVVDNSLDGAEVLMQFEERVSAGTPDFEVIMRVRPASSPRLN